MGIKNKKNYIKMINYIDTNERRIQKLRCIELVDECNDLIEMQNSFKQEAMDNMKILCDSLAAFEEKYDQLLKE